MAELVENLRGVESLVWGGDWNHAMTGREYAGSIGGRRAILGAVEQLGLEVPTAGLPHAIDGLLTIDHIAVPANTRRPHRGSSPPSTRTSGSPTMMRTLSRWVDAEVRSAYRSSPPTFMTSASP